MSLSSSLGVTVLLALVAFQSSALAGDPRSVHSRLEIQLHDGLGHLPLDTHRVRPNTDDLLSALKERLSNGQIRAEERILRRNGGIPYFLPNSPTLGELIGLLEDDETKCDEDFFERAWSWYTPLIDWLLSEYIADAIGKRRFLCLSKLDTDIEKELGSSSESTRKQYEDFHLLRIDRETLRCPDSAFGFLLRHIGVPVKSNVNANAVQRMFVERIVSACNEIAARTSLKTTRTNYARLYEYELVKFPHITFYDFCRALVDFDLEPERDSALNGEGIKYFLKKLDEIQARDLSGSSVSEPMSAETAESGGEERRLVAEAAIRYAEQRSAKLTSRNGKHYAYEQRLYMGLHDLYDICRATIRENSNLIWMYHHMYDVLCLRHGHRLEPAVEQKFRSFERCDLVTKIKFDEIVKEAVEKNSDGKVKNILAKFKPSRQRST
jgi:hypothetical protein